MTTSIGNAGNNSGIKPANTLNRTALIDGKYNTELMLQLFADAKNEGDIEGFTIPMTGTMSRSFYGKSIRRHYRHWLATGVYDPTLTKAQLNAVSEFKGVDNGNRCPYRAGLILA